MSARRRRRPNAVLFRELLDERDGARAAAAVLATAVPAEVREALARRSDRRSPTSYAAEIRRAVDSATIASRVVEIDEAGP